MEFIRRFYIFSSTIIEADRGNMAQKTNFARHFSSQAA